MIRGRRILLAAAPILVYAAMVGCKSSSSTPTSTSAQTGASVTLAAASTIDATKAIYDILITGGLTAEWKNGDGSSGASCVLANDGYAALNLYGPIGATQYGLGYSQNQFAAGTFTYPYASVDPLHEPPFIQIATSSNSAVDWTAGSVGLGSGTAVVTGAKGSPVKLTVDLDMTPRAGGQIVHVKGTLDCPTT